MTRSRSWCFTLNNYTIEECIDLFDINFQYLVVGFEIGEEGTEHIQGYVYFEDTKTLKRLKKWLPRAHFEKAKGTPLQASTYCKKDGDFHEFGVHPRQGKLQFEELEVIMKDPRINFHLYNQYRKAYVEYKTSQQEPTRVRKFIAIPAEYRFKAARSHETTVFMDPEIETYNREDVAILETYSSFHFENWYNGYPPRFKRGYELIIVDPSVVYITYADLRDLGHIRKLYDQYIDRVWLTSELEKMEKDSGQEALNLYQLESDP